MDLELIKNWWWIWYQKVSHAIKNLFLILILRITLRIHKYKIFKSSLVYLLINHFRVEEAYQLLDAYTRILIV